MYRTQPGNFMKLNAQYSAWFSFHYAIFRDNKTNLILCKLFRSRFWIVYHRQRAPCFVYANTVKPPYCHSLNSDCMVPVLIFYFSCWLSLYWFFKNFCSTRYHVHKLNLNTMQIFFTFHCIVSWVWRWLCQFCRPKKSAVYMLWFFDFFWSLVNKNL